jgi:hypothetical protein
MEEVEKIEQLFNMPAEELARIKTEEWDTTFSGIHGDDLRLLSNKMIQLAILAARMSAYIDARGGEHGKDFGHEKAVAAQNEFAVKIRAVFGFQHPKDDIRF